VPRQAGGHAHGGGDSSASPLAGFPGLDQIVSLLGGSDAITNMMSSIQAAVMPRVSGLMSTFGPLAVKFLQSQKALKIEEIPPVLRKEAKRVRLTYGPYKLRGQSGVREIWS
jgi:hypothetical protein